MLIRSFFILLRNILLLPFILIGKLRRGPDYVKVSLRGAFHYRKPRWNLFGRKPDGITLDGLAKTVDRILVSRSVKGLVVHLNPVNAGWAALFCIREQLDRLKKANKDVVVVIDQMSNRELYLTSGATKVLSHVAVQVLVMPLGMEVYFLGDAFKRAGIQADFERVGKYKGAVEPLTQSEPSDQYREAALAMVDSLSEHVVSLLAQGRNWEVERAQKVIAEGPYTAEEAGELGLIDDMSGKRPEELLAPEGKERATIKSNRSLFITKWKTVRPLPVFARLPLRGTIRQDSQGGMPSGQGVFSGQVTRVLEEIAANPTIRGVLLHVDSRGGSAVASDAIWRAVDECAKKKPVVAWFGEVAASGGYYLATAADRIVCAPGTLTGSIGVFAGKVVLGELFGNLGINPHLIARNDRAGLFSASRSFSEDERAWLRRELEQVYGLFIRRVAQGRELSEEVVRSAAEGRVWTGSQALVLKLVDSLGSYDDAMGQLRELAGLNRRGEHRVFEVAASPLEAFGLKGIAGRLAQDVAQGFKETARGAVGLGALPAPRQSTLEEIWELGDLVATESILAYCPPVNVTTS